MKAVVIALSVILFIACLVLGIQAGNASLRWGENTAPNPPTATQQQTILLIGVDDLSQADPSLVSLWLALYRSDFPRITLLPLYPAVAEEDSSRLPGAFQIQPDGAIAPEFLNAVSEYHVSWDGYLLMDQPGTAALVDFLGGLEINATPYTGQAAVDWLAANTDGGLASLQSQRQAGEAICARLASLPPEADWSAIQSSLMGVHVRATLDVSGLIEDWRNIRQTANLACEIPQP